MCLLIIECVFVLQVAAVVPLRVAMNPDTHAVTGKHLENNKQTLFINELFSNVCW